MAEILVVDDEIGIRNVLSEILSDSGYAVFTAANAEEARAMTRSRQFSLILLDIWMPDTDGITLLREWRTHNQLKSPVVMMSGHGTIDSAMQAVRDGAMDFLEKPISLKTLLNTIERVMAKWAETTSQREKKSSETLPGNASGRTLPVFDLPDYHLHLDFNLPYRDVLQAFEKAYFETVLLHQELSIARLSRHSGMERTHLYRKLKACGIELENYRIPGRSGSSGRGPEEAS